jgi:hypothetical protein
MMSVYAALELADLARRSKRAPRLTSVGKGHSSFGTISTVHIVSMIWQANR